MFSASATVHVTGGPFTDRGIIFGKVQLGSDCPPEPGREDRYLGVPGVRLFLEDGTSSLTDAEGTYHFDGVSPRLHIVRVDGATLPTGSELVTTDLRNAGDPYSRFADIKRGELHQSDFVVRAGQRGDSLDIRKNILARRLGLPAPAVATATRGDTTGLMSGPIANLESEAVPMPVASPAPAREGAVQPRVIALGVLEGRLDLRSRGNGSLSPAHASDGFEDQLRDVAVTGADGRANAGSRAALYL